MYNLFLLSYTFFLVLPKPMFATPDTPTKARKEEEQFYGLEVPSPSTAPPTDPPRARRRVPRTLLLHGQRAVVVRVEDRVFPPHFAHRLRRPPPIASRSKGGNVCGKLERQEEGHPQDEEGVHQDADGHSGGPEQRADPLPASLFWFIVVGRCPRRAVSTEMEEDESASREVATGMEEEDLFMMARSLRLSCT